MRVMRVSQTLEYSSKTRKFLWNVWLRDENEKNIHKTFHTKKEAEQYAYKIDPRWNKLFK